ncbi:hypothetical protein M3Y94_00688200 [Aphelenchoides besseyi]|nr:hypothetical protein M3Y94_00688200 [Aphelenchoides besseyi]KAI6231498.1 hypothetical protein M3Y95_00388100 [Aphelenchoides besseyi]
MSEHALLSEVRANLPIQLAVKAADVLWSKDHLTYTNLPTEVVHHRGGHGGHRRRRTSTLRSDHQPHGHALDEAKRIVDDALKKSNTKSGGKGNRNSRNRRSTSGEGDLVALRSKVDWLVKENEDLRSKVQEIHELVQKNVRETVLILGDGNFSYSRAYSHVFPRTRLTATVLEADEREFCGRYPSGSANLAALRDSNVNVEFAIDATQLPSKYANHFQTILMNFPHPGGKTNLRSSRRLLSGIFEAIARIRCNVFELALTLLQSGLNLRSFIDFQTTPQHNKDSWQPAYLAAEFGLLLRNVKRFRSLHGYEPTGYLNREQSFHNHTGIVLCFCPSLIPRSLAEAATFESTNEFNSFAPFYRFDLSILFADHDHVEELESEVIARIQKTVNSLVKQIDELKELRSLHDGKLNRIYRLSWQTTEFALSRRLCNQFHEELKSELLVVFQNRPIELSGTSVSEKPKASEKKVEVSEEKKDEDFDLFGSESEDDEEKERIKEERLKAYAEKKAKKPGPIAKSSVILDVKPWDDETDLKEMEKLVKSIEQDGLVWGASKSIPIGYGINKLQVVMTIEDEKVSVDDLIEKITSDFESHVQSCDIVAFNKI